MKHYYIKHPRNFSNEYSLVWIESDDKITIAEATAAGFERISWKAARRKVSNEKHARKYDQAFSGYGDTVILPYKTVNLPELPEYDRWEEYFEYDGDGRGILRHYCGTHEDVCVRLCSDNGIVYYPITTH